VELKQTETGQTEHQQGKKRQITANKVCIESKVVKLFVFNSAVVLLFCETTETSLFVLDSVKISLGSSFGSFDMNQVLKDTLPRGDAGGGPHNVLYQTTVFQFVSAFQSLCIELCIGSKSR
jgi:hypothetical protein